MMKRFQLALALSTLMFAAGCKKDPPPDESQKAGAQAPTKAGQPGKAGADGVQESDLPAGSRKGTLDDKGQVQEAAAKDGMDGAGSISAADADAVQDIFFDYDRSDLRPEARETLKVVADLLKKHKNAKLTIEGHCDARGTEEYNQALGQRRADSARAYLANLGITRSRISTVSFGESQANQNAETESQWQQDRRAKFVFK